MLPIASILLPSSLYHDPPQLSQFPQLKSRIDWTVQRSPGYLSNEGSVRVGETTWVIEQQIKSFATFEDQELLLKLKVGIPQQQQEHYFLFNHKVFSCLCIFVLNINNLG